MKRPVSPADIELICHHRDEMFRELGRTEVQRAAMAPQFREWLAVRLSSGVYYGFIAEDDGRAIGGVGLMELDWPPHPEHLTETRRGYVFNMFVEPEARGRGIARALMEAAEHEFARRGIAYAVLHASVMGRPLYEKTGWKQTNEMSKRIGALPER